MTARMRLNSALVPLLAIGMVVMQLIDPSKLWQGLIVAFAGTWLICWFWAGSLKGQLRLTREVRYGWAQVGDKLEEQFTLTNNGIAPATWVEIVDHSDLPDYSAGRAVGVGSYETNTWRTAGLCTRRGVYTLGGTTLRSGDPFGMYTVEVHLPESSTLVVMPPIVPLPSIEILPGGWMGEGRPRPNMPEQTVHAITVREHQQGESLKRIHWPTSARRAKLFTRVMDGAPANDWWIALDVESSVQAGQGWENTVELGVIAAASLADRGLRARHSVGLLASGTDTTWLKPQSGEAHRLEIMRALARLSPGNLPLTELLERAGPTLGHRTSLILITPSVKNDWLTSLTRLLWRGISPTVLLLDPASFGAPERADALADVLGRMNIPRFILSRDLLERPEARPGWRGQWEWRIMPTGKAVSIRSQADMTWKRLG
jgi:uncharacterized protein (DUF58 family)